jgi:hypothetical protein
MDRLERIEAELSFKELQLEAKKVLQLKELKRMKRGDKIRRS